MAESKLKPCPFCGHTGLSFGDGSTHRWGSASCDGCGITIEVRREYPDTGALHADAIAEWNKRVPAPEAQRLEAEVQRLNHSLRQADTKARWDDAERVSLKAEVQRLRQALEAIRQRTMCVSYQMGSDVAAIVDTAIKGEKG